MSYRGNVSPRGEFVEYISLSVTSMKDNPREQIKRSDTFLPRRKNKLHSSDTKKKKKKKI